MTMIKELVWPNSKIINRIKNIKYNYYFIIILIYCSYHSCENILFHKFVNYTKEFDNCKNYRILNCNKKYLLHLSRNHLIKQKHLVLELNFLHCVFYLRKF